MRVTEVPWSRNQVPGTSPMVTDRAIRRPPRADAPRRCACANHPPTWWLGWKIQEFVKRTIVRSAPVPRPSVTRFAAPIERALVNRQLDTIGDSDLEHGSRLAELHGRGVDARSAARGRRIDARSAGRGRGVGARSAGRAWRRSSAWRIQSPAWRIQSSPANADLHRGGRHFARPHRFPPGNQRQERAGQERRRRGGWSHPDTAAGCCSR